MTKSLKLDVMAAAENEEAFGLEHRSYQLNTDDAQNIAVKYCEYRIVSAVTHNTTKDKSIHENDSLFHS